eukprot:967187_1
MRYLFVFALLVFVLGVVDYTHGENKVAMDTGHILGGFSEVNPHVVPDLYANIAKFLTDKNIVSGSVTTDPSDETHDYFLKEISQQVVAGMKYKCTLKPIKDGPEEVVTLFHGLNPAEEGQYSVCS